MPAVMERTVSVDRALAQRAERKLRRYGWSGKKVRKGLDPSFYGDLATFRAAVAAGTVDASKGCRNMAE